ncbi:ABC transporter ATP-binding protein [Stieleria sp. JC731]|uniref:ABC transporter ATP-binding protein n=1 Tax=Pirellulaceae TaxID=2691357 RepID=UPI001E3586A9|nr:ABC transporter ATP-binding protein [Stieleria sp. JC731]MCC9602919.1 ABC transporter ATP-binding protein [Stieleria sp. JC731]
MNALNLATTSRDPNSPAVGSPVVACDGLSKQYGSFQALEDCSLTVHEGDVFGLLGPNGAGKTTLIRSLLGYLQRTSGSVRVCGVDPQTDSVEVRRRVSYLPGDARLPRHLRGEGVLRFFADIHPLGDYQRSRDIADDLELDTRRHVGMMSTGMRQKLALAVVLAPPTPLLILDEPTANLDPSVRATVLRYVMDAHQAGRTVMFSSHVLSEIEETCNRVAFLRRGRLARELVMSELFQRHRIWGDFPSPLNKDQAQHLVPDHFRNDVSVEVISTCEASTSTAIRIDTSGDLAPLLDWINSLNLSRLRIEPLGLRSIYDSVHHQSTDDPRVTVASTEGAE